MKREHEQGKRKREGRKEKSVLESFTLAVSKPLLSMIPIGLSIDLFKGDFSVMGFAIGICIAQSN